MEGITKDVKNNWALKLGNLRRLKKGLDKYSEQELKVNNSKFERIDLPLIARTGNADEIMKLFEYVMLVIVSCPKKTVFVRRIMELEEDVQMHMMFFIQKVMGNEEEPIQQQDAQKKELDALKAEKKKLSEQVLNLEQELTLAHEEYAALHSETHQVKMENEKLLFDLGRKNSKGLKSTQVTELELILKISEKDEVIDEMKKTLEKNRRKYENDISQLRDDLDIANNKLVDAVNNEKIIGQYKKRLENYSQIKQQLEDIQHQNENMNNKLNAQRIEIESLTLIKNQFNHIKEQFDQEKIKCETLSFRIENKEKQVKKLEKTLEDYKEKVVFLHQKINDLESADLYNENSHLSESSLAGHLLSVSKDRFKVPEQVENLNKELEKYKSLLLESRAKKTRLKESKRMLNEDFSGSLLQLYSKFDTQQQFIDELENNNFYLSEEIQKLNEAIKSKETDSMLYTQALEELQELKISRANLISEYKDLLGEKEELLAQFGDLTSENLAFKSQISIKNNIIKDLESQTRSLEEKIQSLQETNNDNPDSLDLKYKRVALAAESRVSELQQRIKDLTNENNKTLEESQKQIKIAQEAYTQELKKKDEDVVRLTEEAINELMKHREQLVCKLQSERKNSIMNFQRAMSIRESPFSSNKEVFKLREILMNKEKEIAKLNRNNKELKKCWNHTAKLLKAVWKELGKETLKIEEAVKDSAIE